MLIQKTTDLLRPMMLRLRPVTVAVRRFSDVPSHPSLKNSQNAMNAPWKSRDHRSSEEKKNDDEEYQVWYFEEDEKRKAAIGRNDIWQSDERVKPEQWHMAHAEGDFCRVPKEERDWLIEQAKEAVRDSQAQMMQQKLEELSEYCYRFEDSIPRCQAIYNYLNDSSFWSFENEKELTDMLHRQLLSLRLFEKDGFKNVRVTSNKIFDEE